MSSITTYSPHNECLTTEIAKKYASNPNINFNKEDESLSVTLETQRLFLRSINKNDEDDYKSLLTNEEVTEKYMDGKKWDENRIHQRVSLWSERWEKNIPYSSLAVFAKQNSKYVGKDQNEFIGHVVLGLGNEKHQSELAYLFLNETQKKEKLWGKRFGTEAVTAVVESFALATIEKGYTLPDGEVLKEITATARLDNQASDKILKNLGMKLLKQEEKYGALRNHYSLEIEEIKEKKNTPVNT